MFLRVLAALVLFSMSLQAKEEKIDFAKLSESLGHLIGKNLQTMELDFDLDLVIKGLKDGSKGKSSPMSDEECIQVITVAQENLFKAKAEENLKKADIFLKENAKKQDVVVVEEGKLHYKVQKKGVGQEVEAHSNPVIRYKGKLIDGTVFGESKEDETISLDETIPGFSKGLVGMKEGETRTLYIHPDYAYGTQRILPPNSLLTFDIEIVKANAPVEPLADSLIMEPTLELKNSHKQDDVKSLR